jgi:hypothetical protein
MINGTYTAPKAKTMHVFFAEYGMDLQGPLLGYEL